MDTPSVKKATATTLIFVIIMVRKTPWVRAITLADINAAAPLPAAIMREILTVLAKRDGGTHAEARFCPKATAKTAPEIVRPRRVSRLASIPRALANRPESVPGNQPSCRAASCRDLPSKSHKTMGTRYLLGR